MTRAIVTGGGSGLGAAIVHHLEETHGIETLALDRAHGFDVRDPSTFGRLPPQADILVNCAGVNKIAWLDDLDLNTWDEVMDVNARALWQMTQALLPQLRESRGTVLNIVSNAAHVPMRCSAAYNASKGAALMLTKQMARELISDGITVFSVSPNKLAGTGMSTDIDEQVMKTRGWSREYAQQYQLAGLLTGEETDVNTCAEFIAFLLSTKQRHKYLAGCDIPYGL